MKRYALTLDLKPDPALIEAYEAHHQNVWPEILESIRESGILNMEIYRFGARLFMIMETVPDFSFERKAQLDAANKAVQRWEQEMWKYQAAVPGAAAGEKWVLMDKIFEL